MSQKWLIWALKLFWVLGLFGLLLIGYELQQAIQQKVDSTFEVLQLFWFHATVPFIFGLYISLLFVKGSSFKFNPSLFFCVTTPCLIVSFYMPVVFTFGSNATSDSSFGADITFLMLKINSFGIAPIVAGLTLFTSLFQVVQPSKN